MIYPFDEEKEMQVQARVAAGNRGEIVDIFNTPISEKENMRLTFNHERPAWIGQDFNNILPRIIPENVARAFVHDAKPFDNATEGGGPDWFGVIWKYDPSARGSMVKPGNPKVKDIEEWEDYITFPDLDALDWETSGKENECMIDPNRMTGTTIFTGFFERLISFIDFEDAAVALIDEDQQEAVHRLFDKLADFYDKEIEKLHTYYHVERIEFHDDWGSQRAPFFSRDTCEEMILPYLKRVVESCHKRGIIFSLHSCGMVEPLVPVMIEAGVDSWGGQPMNDKWKLYEMYGDKMLFTIDTKLDPNMPEEEVEAWVKEQMAKVRTDRNILMNASRHPKMKKYVYKYSRQIYGKE